MEGGTFSYTSVTCLAYGRPSTWGAQALIPRYGALTREPLVPEQFDTAVHYHEAVALVDVSVEILERVKNDPTALVWHAAGADRQSSAG